jgi:hypothetical protein
MAAQEMESAARTSMEDLLTQYRVVQSIHVSASAKPRASAGAGRSPTCAARFASGTPERETLYMTVREYATGEPGA